MALRNWVLDGLLLIRDDSSCRAEPLAIALTKSTKSLAVLTVPGRDVVLRRRYCSALEGATFVFLTNDDSWEAVEHQIISAAPSACLLDCLDIFTEKFDLDSVAAFIFRLKNKLPILTIASKSSLDEKEFKRLQSVADSIIAVQANDGQCVANTTIYKRNGKQTNSREIFTINKDMKVSSLKYVQHESSRPEVQSIRNMEDLAMELQLREKEELAKKGLGLPYTSATKQSELVSLRAADKKVRVGGQIIYTPDRDDDMDDSDPDDDLNL